MPKYMIERTIQGAAHLSNEELRSIAQLSCNVLAQLGTEIQWVQSYVAGDKFYCVYNAPSEVLIQEHAQKGGFPADLITKIQTIVDPTTAEA
jgi:hypothetical protein